MTAYYNEIDPSVAKWLRNLIEAGHIAPGYVDERSIEDVFPSDLRGFTQCHFFAGIGVWSHALRASGWSDDRPVWTGSCPCQPFSAAGKGAGFDDERHLWPAFHHLISQCKPAIVLGEQVASKDADTWIDLVHTDLEALGYAFGAIPFPAAGVGSPHIRDRLYWVADTQQHYRGSQTTAANHGQQEADRPTDRTGGCGVLAGRLADTECQQREKCLPRCREGNCAEGGRQAIKPSGLRGAGRLADTDSHGCKAGDGVRLHGPKHDAEHGSGQSTERPSPTNGHWRDADWLLCRDGKWRPVEPGTFPLAHGAPARVVRLRAYGNAINAKAAQAFIECVM